MESSTRAGYAASAPLSVADSQERLEQEVTAVFVEMRDGVYRYLCSSLADPGDADDLTQEVFLRLYATLRSRRNVRNLRAWLFRVAHNLAVDWQRDKISGGTAVASPAERADPSPSAEQSILQVEESQRIQRAIAGLSRQQRQCLELRAEGLRYREIAEILNIGIPTVQTFLARAVKKLGGGDDV